MITSVDTTHSPTTTHSPIPPHARARFAPAILLVAVLSVACDGNSGEAGKRPLSEVSTGAGGADGAALPPGMTALAAARLDSGNVAFRRRAYDEALRYYRAAALDVPAHPAPWYGIYMVGQATGNGALSDSASQAVSSRSGGGELLDTGNIKAHQTPSAAPANHPVSRPLD